MHRFGVPAFVAILFGIFAGCSFAQKAADNQDLTADELSVNASRKLRRGCETLSKVRRGLHGTDRMKAVFKRRHDAEVPAAPAQFPEKVWELGVARGGQSAVGGDDICGEQVIAGEAVEAIEPAEAAAQRDAGDTPWPKTNRPSWPA